MTDPVDKGAPAPVAAKCPYRNTSWFTKPPGSNVPTYGVIRCLAPVGTPMCEMCPRDPSPR